MLKIYGIRNCDTMKKAFAWLEANGVAYDFVDYKKPGVVAAHLADWNRRVGWKALLNTRGLTWRRLSDDDRAVLAQGDEAKALALMTAHPTLIKRPLAEASAPGARPESADRLLVGFDAQTYREHFAAGTHEDIR